MEYLPKFLEDGYTTQKKDRRKERPFLQRIAGSTHLGTIRNTRCLEGHLLKIILRTKTHLQIKSGHALLFFMSKNGGLLIVKVVICT